MANRVTELEAEIAALRRILEELTTRDGRGELAFRGEANRPLAIPETARTAADAVLRSNAGRDLLRQIQRLEEVARAARRSLYHMQRHHDRLVATCEYCSFEFRQLERAIVICDGERDFGRHG